MNLNEKTFDRFSQSECGRYGVFLRCFLCWECCFNLTNAKSEICAYSVILTGMGIVCLLFLLPMSSDMTQFTPCCRNGTNQLAEMCEEYSGPVFVYRLSVAFILFFLICGTLHWATKRSHELKSNLRKGVWFGKMLVLFLICLGASYIPAGNFDEAWTIFLMFGAAIFMVFQLYTFVRFSYVIIFILHKKAERGSKHARRIQAALFALGVSLAIIGNGTLLYIYPFCTENFVFLISNTTLPFLACLWSTSECVKEKNGYSGYIQGSVLTCFVTANTWSAFSNNPDENCNPYFVETPTTNPFHILFFFYAFGIYLVNALFTYNIYVDELRGIREECTTIGFSFRGSSEDGSSTEDLRRVKYPWVLCNIICAALICFTVMNYVNWAPGNANSDHIKANRNAMWFKLIGCWFSIFFFLITLYMPSVHGLKVKPLFVQTH